MSRLGSVIRVVRKAYATFGRSIRLIRRGSGRIAASITFLLFLALPFATANDEALVLLQSNVTRGFGFDVIDPGPRTLHVILQSNSGTLMYSGASDPTGQITWTSPNNNQNGTAHDWYAQNVFAQTVNTTTFYAYLSGGMPYSYGGAQVTHLDLDLEANGYSYPGMPSGNDDTEATDGVEIPITDPGQSTLPDTYPGNNGTGRALLFALNNNGRSGTLSFEISGSGLAVYRLNSMQNQWERVTAGIPIDQNNSPGSFQLHTSSQFTGNVEITARFAHTGGALDAADKVKAVPEPGPQLVQIDPVYAEIPVGDPITIEATGTGLENVQWVASEGGNPDSGMGANFTTQWFTTGEAEVTATLGPTTLTAVIVNVGVLKIVERGTEDEGPLYIPQGSTVELQAFPEGGQFPEGQPVWSVVEFPEGSNLGGFQDSGDVIEFTPDQPGQYQVRARCGISSRTIVVNVSTFVMVARDDDYYLNGIALNNILSEASQISARGTDGQPTTATVNGILANDTVPQEVGGLEVSIELVEGPQFAAEFNLDTETGAFTYTPADQPNSRWLDRVYQWKDNGIISDDTIPLRGRSPADRFRGDYFIYRLTATINGEVYITPDALVRILAPRVYRRGNPNNSNANGLGGLALVGGGESNFQTLFNWLAERANGGDIVVLKASQDSAYYPDELINRGNPPPNSVTSIVLGSSDDANLQSLADYVSQAEAIFIGGGDQGRYIAEWRGTLVGGALSGKSASWNQTNGCAIAGSSAGMHILGSVDYTANRGTAESSVVLQNPTDRTISETSETPLFLGEQLAHPGILVFDPSFIGVQNGIMDSHFYQLNRMGRWMIFMAKSSGPGLTADEATAYIQEPGGSPYVLAQESGSVYRSDNGVQNPVIENNLAFSCGSTQITRFQSNEPAETYSLTVNSGTLSSTAAGGAIYGMGRENP